VTAKVPGLQYVVVNPDGPVFEYDGGFADLADPRPMDAGTTLQFVLRKHPRLAPEPGAKYAYSNIGYWLLGPIVDPKRHAAGCLARWSAFNLMKRLLIDWALIGERNGAWIEIKPHQLNGPAFGGLVGPAGSTA